MAKVRNKLVIVAGVDEEKLSKSWHRREPRHSPPLYIKETVEKEFYGQREEDGYFRTNDSRFVSIHSWDVFYRRSVLKRGRIRTIPNEVSEVFDDICEMISSWYTMDSELKTVILSKPEEIANTKGINNVFSSEVYREILYEYENISHMIVESHRNYGSVRSDEENYKHNLHFAPFKSH